MRVGRVRIESPSRGGFARMDLPVDQHTESPQSREPDADPLDAARAVAYVAQTVDLYVTLLDRVPDGPELRDGSTAFIRGLGAAVMQQRILATPEYRIRHTAHLTVEAIEASGLFDPAWYLHANQDVGGAGVAPIAHYAHFGRAEGRAPNAYLRPDWYRSTYNIPDEVDILAHYMIVGEPAGLAPTPDFDPAWYRDAYGIEPDISPLAHFLANRAAGKIAPCARLWSLHRTPADLALPDGHDVFSFYSERHPRLDPLPVPDLDLVRQAGVFDENYYVLHSGDVLDAGVDAVDHFCRYGWREGRDPNVYFKTTWYAQTNPEVGRLKLNPLVHYLVMGESQGRRPVVYFDPAWYRERYNVAPATACLAHYLEHRRTQTVSPHPLFDPAYYIAHCGTVVHPRRDPFSHFLFAGMRDDVPPSSAFDPAAWRQTTRGRRSRHFNQLLSPDRDNPLIDYLLSTYDCLVGQ